MTNQNLIKACIKKDPAAQKQLFEQYGGMLMGVCKRYARNEYEADDFFQEGFIRILEKIDTFKYQGEHSLEYWMRRIMINTSLGYLRDKQRKFGSIDEKYADENEIEDDESSSKFSDQLFNADISKEELMNMLNQLSENTKVVFNLHIIEGWSHAEIAKHLEIKEIASRARLVRARNNLQKMLLSYLEEKREHESK